jgi:hypothetical protein
MADQRTPFDSIEGALEYVGMLGEAIEKAKRGVEAEATRARAERAARRIDALQLAAYKLDLLASRVGSSHRLLNDLRTLRRLLLGERQDRDEKPPL